MTFYLSLADVQGPLILSVDLARRLASSTGFLPTPVLLAAAAVLRADSRQVLADVRAHPGRRGNPARREQAGADVQLAGRVLRSIEARWRVMRRQFDAVSAAEAVRSGINMDGVAALRTTVQRRTYEVDSMPALGPKQWAVVAAHASTWHGAPAELATIAQTIVPDEPPLEIGPWLHWWRNKRWTEEALQSEDMASSVEFAADTAETEAAEVARLADEARLYAVAVRGSADRLRAIAEMYKQAAGLEEEGLAVFSDAVDAGVPLAVALARVTRPAG